MGQVKKSKAHPINPVNWDLSIWRSPLIFDF